MIISRERAELFATWFRCLGEPTRIQILNLLACERRAMSVGEIVDAVGLGQSTVSEHLRRLADARFVLVEHRGTSSFVQINDRCIDCLPSAAELVMGEAKPELLTTGPVRAGATSPSVRRQKRRVNVGTRQR